MSTRASAARYARALLDVVIKEGNPEQVEQELSALADQQVAGIMMMVEQLLTLSICVALLLRPRWLPRFRVAAA